MREARNCGAGTLAAKARRLMVSRRFRLASNERSRFRTRRWSYNRCFRSSWHLRPRHRRTPILYYHSKSKNLKIADRLGMDPQVVAKMAVVGTLEATAMNYVEADQVRKNVLEIRQKLEEAGTLKYTSDVVLLASKYLQELDIKYGMVAMIPMALFSELDKPLPLVECDRKNFIWVCDYMLTQLNLWFPEKHAFLHSLSVEDQMFLARACQDLSDLQHGLDVSGIHASTKTCALIANGRQQWACD